MLRWQHQCCEGLLAAVGKFAPTKGKQAAAACGTPPPVDMFIWGSRGRLCCSTGAARAGGHGELSPSLLPHEGVPPPTRAALAELKPRLLKARALEAGVDTERVEEAMDADDIKEALIVIILEKIGRVVPLPMAFRRTCCATSCLRFSRGRCAPARPK